MVVTYHQKSMYDSIHRKDNNDCDSCDVANYYYSQHPEEIIFAGIVIEGGLIFALLIIPLLYFFIPKFIKWLNRRIS